MTEKVYEYVCPNCSKVIKFPYPLDEFIKSKIDILYCSGCGANLTHSSLYFWRCLISSCGVEEK